MGIGFGYEVIARSKSTGRIMRRFRLTTLKASIVKKKMLMRMKSIGKVSIRDLSRR